MATSYAVGGLDNHRSKGGKMNTALEAIYLDYFNNYLSLAKFAEDYRLKVEDAKQLLDLLRKIKKESEAK